MEEYRGWGWVTADPWREEGASTNLIALKVHLESDIMVPED